LASQDYACSQAKARHGHMDIVLRKISFSAWTSRDCLNIDICRVASANNISWAPQLGFSS